MKMPIGLHKDMLRNQKQSLEHWRISLNNDLARYAEDIYHTLQYEDQIATAIKEKKDGFDRDKYQIKRKVNP